MAEGERPLEQDDIRPENRAHFSASCSTRRILRNHRTWTERGSAKEITMSWTPSGRHLIAGEWIAGTTTFRSEPAHGPAHDFAVGTTELVDRACRFPRRRSRGKWRAPRMSLRKTPRMRLRRRGRRGRPIPWCRRRNHGPGRVPARSERSSFRQSTRRRSDACLKGSSSLLSPWRSLAPSLCGLCARCAA